MDKAELKRLLRFAADAPVSMAFALGADGKALLVLDRRKPPRLLEKQIKEGAPGAKNVRFGTAAVSPDDPKLVRFSVNKASSGMGRKLVVALKGTGYRKVEIGSEDGAAPERAESDESEEAETQQAGAASGGVTGRSARGQDAIQDAPPAAERSATGSNAQGPSSAAQGGAAGRTPSADNAAGQPAGREASSSGDDADASAGSRSGSGRQEVADSAARALRRLQATGQALPSAAIDAARRVQTALGAGDVDAARAQAAELSSLAGRAGRPEGAADAATTREQGTSPGADQVPTASNTDPQVRSGDTSGNARGSQALSDEIAGTVKRLAGNGPLSAAAMNLARRAQAALKGGDMDAARGSAAELSTLADGVGGANGRGAASPTTASSANGADGAAPEPNAGSTGDPQGTVGDPGRPAQASSEQPGGAQADNTASAAAVGPSAAALQKGHRAWEAVRANIEGGIRATMQAATDELGAEDDDLKQVQARVESVIQTFDGSLSETLARMESNTNPAERIELMAEARQIIAQYRTYADGEPMIAHLDQNPYRPLTIRRTLDAAFSALSQLMQDSEHR